MIAYWDCFAGASGDMILGALVDAGLDVDALWRVLGGLGLQGWDLKTERVRTGGLGATRVKVEIQNPVSERRYAELAELLEQSQVPGDIKGPASRILRRLAEVEARLHGVETDQVHLHELGGLDTLVDVAGAVAGLKLLGIEALYVSAFPIGRGTVDSRHGPLPLPAPAVAELVQGAPIRAVDVNVELVTPTGAAILTTLARGYGRFPDMVLDRVGCGAGTHELPFPNILRVFVGSPAMANRDAVETLVVLETNIDDMNPQIYEFVLTRLLQAGALDAWMTPIQMKKNRGGTLLSALCRPADAEALKEILFGETTTLGLREHEVRRYLLARELISVETAYGPVRVKLARSGGRILRAMPEYDDCRKLAEQHGVPLLEIYRLVESEAYGHAH